MGPWTIEARDNGTDGNSDIMEHVMTMQYFTVPRRYRSEPVGSKRFRPDSDWFQVVPTGFQSEPLGTRCQNNKSTVEPNKIIQTDILLYLLHHIYT